MSDQGMGGVNVYLNADEIANLLKSKAYELSHMLERPRTADATEVAAFVDRMSELADAAISA